VNHRHLLPNEIDLLLDEETGFGVKPLRDHVRDCSDCRARLAEAQALVSELSTVPVFAPRMGLADRVMSQVPVFVPWHVAARDAVMDRIPTGPMARALAATVIAVAGSLVTGLTLLIATRGDILAMFSGLVGEQARETAANALGQLVVAALGPQMLQVMQQVGPLGAVLAAGGFLVASVGTVFGLRRIAASGQARS